MNDAELDRLLDTWETPALPSSLRSGCGAVSAPNAELRPLAAMGAVAAAASVTLAIGMGQSSENAWTSAWSASCMTSTIVSSRASKPGTQPSSCRRSGTPNQGVCDGRIGWAVEVWPCPQWTCRCRAKAHTRSVLSREPERLVKAGYIRDNAIEFQAAANWSALNATSRIVDSTVRLLMRRRERTSRRATLLFGRLPARPQESEMTAVLSPRRYSSVCRQQSSFRHCRRVDARSYFSTDSSRTTHPLVR